MKQFFLSFLLLSGLNSFSQTLPADSSFKEEYCIVQPVAIIFSTEVEVYVDYGNTKRSNRLRRNLLKDENTGEARVFKSETDALNYFGSNGWKIVNVFPVVESGTSSTRYLFKRTVKTE